MDALGGRVVDDLVRVMEEGPAARRRLADEQHSQILGMYVSACARPLADRPPAEANRAVIVGNQPHGGLPSHDGLSHLLRLPPRGAYPALALHEPSAELPPRSLPRAFPARARDQQQGTTRSTSMSGETRSISGRTSFCWILGQPATWKPRCGIWSTVARERISSRAGRRRGRQRPVPVTPKSQGIRRQPTGCYAGPTARHHSGASRRLRWS